MASWPGIICCRLRGRICCGARSVGKRQRKLTATLWRWLRTTRSGAISLAVWRKWNGYNRQMEPAVSSEPLHIEVMTPADWPAVRAIYLEGIATGNATFEQSAPEWEKWDAGHLQAARIVARSNSGILGWAALSGVSSRCVYAGVAEVSVYVAQAARGRGVG